MARPAKKPQKVNAAVIQRLKEEMDKNGDLRYTVAEKAGIAESSFSKLMSLSMLLSVDDLFAIASALDLKASDVVAEAERRLSPVPASSNVTQFPTPPQPTPEQLAKMAAKHDPLGEEIYEDT